MSDLSALRRGRLVGVSVTVVQVSEVKFSPIRGRGGEGNYLYVNDLGWDIVI